MTTMSNDKTAEEIERELIKKEAMDKYPDRARNGLSFPDYNATQRMAYINGIITERTRSAQQLKEYKDVIRELRSVAQRSVLLYRQGDPYGDYLKSLIDKALKLIDQTDSTK